MNAGQNPLEFSFVFSNHSNEFNPHSPHVNELTYWNHLLKLTTMPLPFPLRLNGVSIWNRFIEYDYLIEICISCPAVIQLTLIQFVDLAIDVMFIVETQLRGAYDVSITIEFMHGSNRSQYRIFSSQWNWELICSHLSVTTATMRYDLNQLQRVI